MLNKDYEKKLEQTKRLTEQIHAKNTFKNLLTKCEQLKKETEELQEEFNTLIGSISQNKINLINFKLIEMNECLDILISRCIDKNQTRVKKSEKDFRLVRTDFIKLNKRIQGLKRLYDD